jgi:hypothetical protein
MMLDEASLALDNPGGSEMMSGLRSCQVRATVRLSAAVLAVAVFGGVLGAQQLTVPDGWKWRLDAPARLVTEDAVPDSAWRFVGMPPGWHVTTGPGALLFHTSATASGRFTLQAEFALFPDPPDTGYGIFLGGRNLDGGSPGYLAVVLRRDGQVSLTRRDGATEATVQAWTAHPAIKPHPGRGVVSNRLRVTVAGDSLRVSVNDSPVFSTARTGLEIDGAFGLRVGKGINLHVTSLDHTRHLAPARP